MQATFRVSGSDLHFAADRVTSGERRGLTGADRDRFTGWAATYRALVGKDRAQAELLALGREIHAWLDGGDRWLERLLSAAEPPLLVAFQASRNPDPLASDFLQVPWELLAGAQTFLAADATLDVCPVRRLGDPEAPAPPPVDLCLGITFMAASPRGIEPELDFEAEELALRDATGGLNLDLDVDDTGDPNQLAERLARTQRMQVLHLSCHGRSEPEPVLLMEDAEGYPRLTSATGLIDALPTPRPHLVFLSACQTAQRGATADPLALTLLRAGTPAVLGWDGSVRDTEATAFARELYGGLSRRRPLEQAVAGARRSLLNAEEPARDWHLARLWLRANGGDVIVGGNNRRQLIARDHGHKQMLDKRRQRLPVASYEAFVGRRREIQTALRVLHTGEPKGLLIHGMGRVGKSSLAARLAQRRPDLALAVVFERYDALAIADAVVDACPAARGILDPQREAFVRDGAALEAPLRRVLEGPCQQPNAEAKPLLLLIDDFERILDDPLLGGRHRLKSDALPAIRAVLRAFSLAQTQSRLILTSRFTFELPHGGDDLAKTLFDLHLGPMHESGRRKQASRRLATAAATLTKDQQAHVDRGVNLARGNPGLQDVLTTLALDSSAAARSALDDTEAYLASGKSPTQQAVQVLLDDLRIGRLIALLQPAERELLRALTLFGEPLPLTAVRTFSESTGGSGDRLLGLGLCDRFEDIVHKTQSAIAVNALVRPLIQPPLSEPESVSVSRAILPPLLNHWPTGAADIIPARAHYQLTCLALIAGAPAVVQSSAPIAIELMRQRDAKLAAQLGIGSIALLDRESTPVPLILLSLSAHCVMLAGEGKLADKIFQRAVKAIPDSIDVIMYNGVCMFYYFYYQRLVQTGMLEDALDIISHWIGLEQRLGDIRRVAVAQDARANVLQEQGKVREALSVCKEDILPIYAELGDLRLAVVTKTKIASLLFGLSMIDEAVSMFETEIMPFLTSIGDTELEAAVHSRFADNLAAIGGPTNIRASLDIRQNIVLPFNQATNARNAAITYMKIAMNHYSLEDYETAETIMESKCLPVFRQLTDEKLYAVAQGHLARIKVKLNKLEDAYAMQKSRLATNRLRSDPDGTASALTDLAELDLITNHEGRAYRRLREAWGIYQGMDQQIEKYQGLSESGIKYATLLVKRNRVQLAKQVLEITAGACQILKREACREAAIQMWSSLGG